MLCEEGGRSSPWSTRELAAEMRGMGRGQKRRRAAEWDKGWRRPEELLPFPGLTGQGEVARLVWRGP